MDNKLNAYLSECGRLKVPPRMQGIVNRKGTRSSIKADSRLMGDNYASALGAALARTKVVDKINLSRNSISDKGGMKIMEALPAGLVELDLSYNPLLGRESYELMNGWLKRPECLLRVLRLEGNCAGDKLP